MCQIDLDRAAKNTSQRAHRTLYKRLVNANFYYRSLELTYTSTVKDAVAKCICKRVRNALLNKKKSKRRGANLITSPYQMQIKIRCISFCPSDQIFAGTTKADIKRKRLARCDFEIASCLFQMCAVLIPCLFKWYEVINFFRSGPLRLKELRVANRLGFSGLASGPANGV